MPLVAACAIPRSSKTSTTALSPTTTPWKACPKRKRGRPHRRDAQNPDHSPTASPQIRQPGGGRPQPAPPCRPVSASKRAHAAVGQDPQPRRRRWRCNAALSRLTDCFHPHFWLDVRPLYGRGQANAVLSITNTFAAPYDGPYQRLYTFGPLAGQSLAWPFPLPLPPTPCVGGFPRTRSPVCLGSSSGVLRAKGGVVKVNIPAPRRKRWAALMVVEVCFAALGRFSCLRSTARIRLRMTPPGAELVWHTVLEVANHPLAWDLGSV